MVGDIVRTLRLALVVVTAVLFAVMIAEELGWVVP
jgi:hypothetical protein